MWSYRDSKDGGAFADQELIFAFNRTGAAVARGYVGAVNDLAASLTMNGTSTAATSDGGDADFRKNIMAMDTATPANTGFNRHVIAWKPIAKDGWGPWLIKGEIDESLVSVVSVSGTAAIGSLLTAYTDTDGTTPAIATAGVLCARPIATGTGNLDAYKVPVQIFGRTLASVSTVAATKIRFDGNGTGFAYGA